MQETKKIYGMISLSNKARKLVSGQFSVEKLVRSNHAKLVLAAQDSSAASIKGYQDMCEFYHIPFYTLGTKEALGKSIGKEFRGVVAISDENFASAIMKLMN